MPYLPRLLGALGLTLLMTGCSLLGTPETSDRRTVTVVVHDSFAMDQKVLAEFERSAGLRLDIRPSGDAGELTNKLVLSKANPIGDVVYGIDSTFASRALTEGVLARHPSGSPALNGRLAPVDLADVCVNVDARWFAEHAVPEPTSLRDLTNPRYRNLFAVPDPTVSSPGLAFLLNTVATFGEPGWQDYWRALVGNGAKVSSSWEEVYNQDFSGSAGQGDRPIVLSYASSPAAEVGPDGASRTRALLDTCYRQTEYAGVLAGTDDRPAAGRVVDFLRSREFQSRVPEQMYVYPVVPGIPLPSGWARVAPLPREPAELAPRTVEANRDDWVRQWRTLVRG